MSDPQTANKGLFTPLNGADVDTWDVPMNANFGVLDTALGGATGLNATGLSGVQMLDSEEYQPLKLNVTGTPTAAITYQIPSGVGGIWVFFNATSGGQTVGISSAAGGATVTVVAGENTIVTCDGTSAGMVQAITTTGAAAGSNTQVQYNSAGNLGASAGLTFDGSTLAATGLNIAGNTTLGASSGSTVTLNGTALAIPSSLNINTGSLFINQGTGQVGIGITAGLTSLLTVAGSIKSTTGGFTFPDNTVQTTAAQPTAPAGSNTQIQYNNSGSFGASSSLTFNGGTSTLATVNLSATAVAATTYTGTWAGNIIAIANGGTGVTSLPQSLAANGYQTLVGGLIIQWGTTSAIGSVSSLSVSFPIAFPTVCYSVEISAMSATSVPQAANFWDSLTTNAFTIHNQSPGAAVAFSWFAIGR